VASEKKVAVIVVTKRVFPYLKRRYVCMCIHVYMYICVGMYVVVASKKEVSANVFKQMELWDVFIRFDSMQKKCDARFSCFSGV
jgi:hypothetical protein